MMKQVKRQESKLIKATRKADKFNEMQFEMAKASEKKKTELNENLKQLSVPQLKELNDNNEKRLNRIEDTSHVFHVIENFNPDFHFCLTAGAMAAFAASPVLYVCGNSMADAGLMQEGVKMIALGGAVLACEAIAKLLKHNGLCVSEKLFRSLDKRQNRKAKAILSMQEGVEKYLSEKSL